MEKTFKSIAGYFAVMIFFVMSIVGWFCGHSPATCCSRALTGAIVTYFAVSFAAKTITKVIVKHVIDTKVQKIGAKKN